MVDLDIVLSVRITFEEPYGNRAKECATAEYCVENDVVGVHNGRDLSGLYGNT
jgi:hypothetical protein